LAILVAERNHQMDPVARGDFDQAIESRPVTLAVGGAERHEEPGSHQGVGPQGAHEVVEALDAPAAIAASVV